MNTVILMGRLAKDPDVIKKQEAAISRFILAVDRRFKREGEQNADFISCVAFGKTAEFIEKYGRKGTKFVVEGRIQTGNYTNRDGNKVYTTDVVVESVEFAESKVTSGSNNTPAPTPADKDGFMPIPDDEDELPFN